jgi:hypothetical protein
VPGDAEAEPVLKAPRMAAMGIRKNAEIIGFILWLFNVAKENHHFQ